MTSGTGPATSSGSAVTLATPDLKPSSLPFLTCASGPYRPGALFANGPSVPKPSQGPMTRATWASREALRLTARLFASQTCGSAVLLLREGEPALVELCGSDVQHLGIIHLRIDRLLVRRHEFPVHVLLECRVEVLDHRVGVRVELADPLRCDIRIGIGPSTICLKLGVAARQMASTFAPCVRD